MKGKGGSVSLTLPVDSLRGKSFQEWVVRQPVKMGGMGLRSLTDLSPAAYISVLSKMPVRGQEGLRGGQDGSEECIQCSSKSSHN